MKFGACRHAAVLGLILVACAEGATLRQWLDFFRSDLRTETGIGSAIATSRNYSNGTDNFQDELIDQADPEFAMASGNDDCISWEDILSQLQAQFQDVGADRPGVTDEEREALEQSKRDSEEELRLMYSHSDTNQDGCVDREEFDAVNEMEGPPPGFHDSREQSAIENCERHMVGLGQDASELFGALDTNKDTEVTADEWELGVVDGGLLHLGDGALTDVECGIHIFDFLWQTADSDGDGKINATDLHALFAEFEKDPAKFRVWLDGELQEEIKNMVMFEFDCMDRNADGQVSEEEVFHYAKENMVHADISPEKLKEMFDACDVDSDGLLNFEEFENAGANFQGDGTEHTTAAPVQVEPQALHQLPAGMRPPSTKLAQRFRESLVAYLTSSSKGLIAPTTEHVTRDFVASLYHVGGVPPSPSASFRQALGLELRKLRDKIARLAAESSLRSTASSAAFLGKARRPAAPGK